MQAHEVTAIFDQQAEVYDQQWAKIAPLRDALNLLVAAVFANLPAESRVLCVGAGTGSEILYLAQRFPGFRFTAVEPSGPMLEVCQRWAHAQGIAERCVFHQGYVESLPESGPFDAATSLLVSQFILDAQERLAFFRSIADRLRPGACLASADLCADRDTPAYLSLLEVWMRMMHAADVPDEMVQRMRTVYARDIGILPPAQLADIIATAGFDAPIPFFQGGLIHACYAIRGA